MEEEIKFGEWAVAWARWKAVFLVVCRGTTIGCGCLRTELGLAKCGLSETESWVLALQAGAEC